MKHRFIVPVLILTFAAASCDKWELLNPVDPDAPNYIGIPSADRDGDGIGQYADVDDIVLEAPEDGASVSDGDSLIIRTFRPGLARAYRIQIFTDETNPDTSIVFDRDDYSINECPLPSLSQSSIYYWRAKAFDGAKWSDNWSPVRSFSISYSGGISIDTDMDEPFNVTLSGSTVVSSASPVSVTASSSASVDDYRWYLNGEELSGEFGSSLTLSRDWEEGRHRITLIARAGEVYASADFVFEVGGVPSFRARFWNHDPKEWDNTGGISNDGIWQFDAYSDLKELFDVTLGTPDYDFFQTSVIDFPSGSSSSTSYNPFGNIDGVDNDGSALSLNVDVGNDSIMAVWTGHLKVDSRDAGETTFYTASDDGSVIYIDKNRVVWNNEFQGVTERSGSYNLGSGTHEIIIAFYEGGGGAGIAVKWDGPITGNSKVLIDPTYKGQSGASSFYSSLSGGSFGAVLDAVTGLSPSSTANTTPTLSWNALAGAARYEVQLADSQGGVEQTTPVHAAGTFYTPSTPLADNRIYYWRVRAVNGDGQAGDWSTVASLWVGLDQWYETFEAGSLSSQWTGNWILNNEAYSGSYSLQSSDIGNNQSTSIEIDITVPVDSSISFYRRVSSESGYDYLKFYINGSQPSNSSWSGNVEWDKASYFLSAGEHTLKWVYSKDGSDSSGSDCAWIDDVTIVYE